MRHKKIADTVTEKLRFFAAPEFNTEVALQILSMFFESPNHELHGFR